MAATLNDFTADLEDLVTCCICKAILQTPKTLTCLHTFCLRCLEDHHQQCQFTRKPFSCPTCRTPMPVQEDDVNNIPTSFEHYTLIELYNTIKAGDQQHLPCSKCSSRRQMVGYCFHCGGMLCNICYSIHNLTEVSHKAKLWNEFTKENLISYIDNKFVCPEKYHNNCHLEYYCQPCKKTLCQKCTVTQDHSNHNMVSLEEACEQTQLRLRQERHRLHELVEVHENEQKLCQENRERIQNQVRAIKKKILDDLQAKINIMQEKVNDYNSILDKYLEEQITENDKEKSSIANKLQQACSLQDQCEKMHNLNLKQFILKGHEKLEELCQTTVKGTPILPNGRVKRYTSLRYFPNSEATQILRDLEIGEIEFSVTDPSRCTIESIGQTRCGFMNQFNIITRDTMRNECYADESLIDVQIQGIEGKHANKEITQSQPGTFIVKYKANKPLPYKLEVSIGGTPVSNSPQVAQTIDAKAELQPVRIFKTTAGFHQVSLAVNDSGMIVVTNNNNKGQGSIGLYSVNGQFPRKIGGEGAAEEIPLHNPQGVAFVNTDHILVSDYYDGHGMIKLFDINGNYKRLILRQKEIRFTTMCTTISSIACLAYDVNSIETTIKLFSKQSCDHSQDIKLDISGVGRSFFVAYDNNRYFITFNKSKSIYVFDENGALLNTFGEEAYKAGVLKRPRGLAMFGADMFLVCDAGKHCVHLFDQRGYYIRSFCSRGSNRMNFPRDVVVTPDGQVIILEYGCKRVQVFR